MSDGRTDRDAYANIPDDAINDPYAQPEVRAPRLRVMLGDQELPGAITASVQSNSHYQADRFSATFALNADPAYGLKWWSDQPDLFLDIQIGFDDNDNINWTSMLQGGVDHIDVHPATGLVEVEGRDLTARLIEAKTQESFKNQTASEVATTLAGRHNLTADVQATTTLVSRFYAEDHDHLTLNEFSRTTTEWDLLTYLAQRENFDVWVTGTTLHFKPAVDATTKPYRVLWSGEDGQFSNVIDLRMNRSLTLAKDVEVWVRSWNSHSAKGFTKKARAIGAKSASPAAASNQTGTNTQRFVVVRPNLTEDDAQKLANSMLAEISKHERKIDFRLPGDLTLTHRQMIELTGTNSEFDQRYYVDTIDRRIGFDEGFVMTVTAKNQDSQTQTLVG